MKPLFALALAVTASAQDSLSLKEAVTRALTGHPALAAAAAARDAAHEGVVQAHSGRLPKVNYSESWTRSDNPVFVFSSLLTQRQFTASNFALPTLNQPDFLNNFQSQVIADQTLYDAGKTKRATDLAKLSENHSAESLRLARLSVVAQVARAYYATLLGTEQLRVTAQALRSAESDLERADARRQSGLATDADVLSIKVHVAKVHEEQITRRADLQVAQAALNEAMGLPLDDAHTLTTPLTPLPLRLDAPTAVDDRPEVRQARLAQNVAATRQADARSNYLPQVYARGVFEADRQRFINRGGANWLVSIGLRWNLFNGFADRSRIAETVAAQRQADADLRRTESGVRLQVRQAWAALEAAQQRIATARAAVAAAQESLRIFQNRYGAGLATVTDLLRTETALLETQARELAAVHDQRVAATLLQLAAGTLSAESEVLN